MSYVYILSDYHEYGAQNVVATLNRDSIPDMMRRNFSGKASSDDFVRLIELLKTPDDELCKHDGDNLWSGWGGIQLHVIHLDTTAAEQSRGIL